MLTSVSKNPSYVAGGWQVKHDNFAEVLHYGAKKTYLEQITVNE